MSRSRTPRNRSARDKRLAHERQQRAARRAQEHPLEALKPPFSAYQEWIRIPAQARGMGEYPVPDGMELDGGTRAFADMLVRLAPLYGGSMPMAAVYLEQQIQRSTLFLGTSDGGVRAVPLPDMATVIAETAHHFPGQPQPDPDGEDSEDGDTGRLLHQLHALGALVLDDHHVIRLVALV